MLMINTLTLKKAAVIHNEKEIPLTPKEFIIIKKLWGKQKQNRYK